MPPDETWAGWKLLDGAVVAGARDVEEVDEERLLEELLLDEELLEDRRSWDERLPAELLGDVVAVWDDARLVEVVVEVWRRAARPPNRPTPANDAAANQAVAARARPRTAERCAAGDDMSQLSHHQLGKG